MDIINSNKEKIWRFLFSALVSIAGALLFLLFIGTIFGLVRPRSAEPVLRLGSAVQTEQITAQTGDIRIFSELGRLRVPLANSSVLILSIAFPYSADDIAFTEELVVRINDLRMLASDYFSSLPAANLTQIDEEAAKREILRRFNDNLRLGRIETLFFSDMLVIDAF